jgi:hypothetical protein
MLRREEVIKDKHSYGSRKERKGQRRRKEARNTHSRTNAEEEAKGNKDTITLSRTNSKGRSATAGKDDDFTRV